MYIILIPLAILLVYLYGTRNHGYWRKRGLKYEEPIAFFGGSLRQHMEKISFSERFSSLYKRYPNEKFVGFFEGNRQGLLIRDPEMVKHALVTDFRHFHYRGANFHKDVTEPLMNNIFNVDGDTWKLMRQKLTPMFSSSKLKAMFPLITERLVKLLKIADDHAKTGDEVDMFELMARYTTDFIGACGFGIDADTMNNEMSDFRKLGKRIFTYKFRDTLVNFLKIIGPELFKHVKIASYDVETPTLSLVTHIMAQRDFKPIGRNDFIDLMLELKQKGKIVGESMEKRNPDGQLSSVEIEVDNELIIAQVFVFFAAGFETSSSASSYLLHLLAYHPEEQARCHKDVDEVLKKHNGVITYDAIREMKYLEMAMLEGLRISSSPGYISRKTVTEYTFPGTNLTIEPGTAIIISIAGSQNDPQYFEDPEEFRPQRFHPDNIDSMKKCVFMPFGDGPRACVGERMGLMQSTAGVAAILSKYSVSPSKSSIRHPHIHHTSRIVQIIVGGLPLTLTRR